MLSSLTMRPHINPSLNSHLIYVLFGSNNRFPVFHSIAFLKFSNIFPNKLYTRSTTHRLTESDQDAPLLLAVDY